jgi:hypothetical protein
MHKEVQMSRKRISMRKIKEVLRLRFEVGLSYDAIGQSCNIGHTTVGEYLRRAKDAGLRWPLPEDRKIFYIRDLFVGTPTVLSRTGAMSTRSSRRKM